MRALGFEQQDVCLASLHEQKAPLLVGKLCFEVAANNAVPLQSMLVTTRSQVRTIVHTVGP